MPKDYEAVRDSCLDKKRKAKKGKALTKAEISSCKEMAVKWWVKKHGKPFPKHGKGDTVLSSELRDILLTDEFWADNGSLSWAHIHDDKTDYDTVDMIFDKIELNEQYIRLSAVSSITQFKEFAIRTIEEGVKEVVGVTGDTKQPQSYLFLKDSFTLLEAIKWTVNHSIQTRVSKASIQGASASEIDAAFDHKATIYCKASISKDGEIDVTKLAEAGIEVVDRDILPVSFKLVHANTNKNKDKFLPEELEASKSTPVLKPIDWMHTPRIIGVMASSNYVVPTQAEGDDTPVEDPYLHVAGAIYQYKFPEYAAEMIERESKDELFFSMEVWFNEAECSECQAVATASSDYCEHLKARFTPGSSAARILRGLTFGGAGVVEHPADEDAVSTSLGGETNESNAKEDINMPSNTNEVVFKDEAELAAYVQAKLDEQKEASESSEAMKQLQDDLSTANDKITELEGTIEEKDKEISKLNDEKADVQKEFDDFKSELDKDKQLEARIEELTEAGVSFPEDKEAKEKVFASIREMDEDSYVPYKDVILASVNKPAKDDDNDADDDTAVSYTHLTLPTSDLV